MDIIARMNKERWSSIVHNWKPTGKRPVGRPKQRWMDNKERISKELVCDCMALPQGETELDSKSWLETEKGGRTSVSTIQVHSVNYAAKLHYVSIQ